MCEIMDKSRNQKVTLFGCINLGSKLNSNKTRVMITYFKMHLVKVSSKRTDPHEQTLMGTITANRTFAIAYLLMQRPHFIIIIMFRKD